MAKTVHEEILDWSNELPKWQRDALRRLFVGVPLTSQDHAELLAICKKEHGLAAPATYSPLLTSQVGVSGPATDDVALRGVTHHQGVNNLAANQTVTFGSNLTVVCGQNASGKSGYTRILKRACRSRGVEDILGDVLSGQAPAKAKATITYRAGALDKTSDWRPDDPLSELGAISVFDADCVPVYLRDKTDVAFRPFSLDIFDKLAACCQTLKTMLEAELTVLNSVVTTLPNLAPGTSARTLLDGLSGLTNSSDVKALTTFSPKEEQKLRDLQTKRRDLQASDPKRLAKDLELKAGRVQLIADHISKLSVALDEKAFEVLRSTHRAVAVAEAAVTTLQASIVSAGTLPGTGSQLWRQMWESWLLIGGANGCAFEYSDFSYS